MLDGRWHVSLCSVIIVIPAVMIFAISFFQIQILFAQSESWYVGKGVEQDTYYTYQIQEHDTNQGRPFFMTIYFEEFDSSRNIWIAPVFVVDQGRVFNGTFHLSDLDLSVLGSSEVPPEMARYRNAYTNSLQWLAAFVPKPGQSLSAPFWGKIAAIGGQPVSPLGAAQITIPSGTFNTIAVGWHYGEDNRIWINPDMPYPVKAETFAAVTTGNPPVQYAYELQSTGKGQPPIPESQFEAPEPPLTVRTPRGTYFIQLIWNPPIVSGAAEEFGLIFMDNRQVIQDMVTYAFTANFPNNTILSEVTNQRALDGTSTQIVTFPEPGRYIVEVNVESVAGQPLGIFVESARFNILVD